MTLRVVVALTKTFKGPFAQLDVVILFIVRVMKEVVYCLVPEGVELVEDFNCLELLKLGFCPETSFAGIE